MKKTQSSIRGKLMRIVLVTSAVVLFLTCAAFITYEFFTYRLTAKSQLLTLAQITAAHSTAAVSFQDSEVANETLDALKAEKNIVAACLYDGENNLFVTYPSTIDKTRFAEKPGASTFKFKDGFIEGFQPVVEKNKRVGTLFLRYDMSTIYTTIQQYTIIVLIVFVVSFFVAYLLSIQLQKTVSDPILALANTAGFISNENDYSVRAKKYDEDEVGVLTDAFNQMLAQIERQNDEIISLNQELEKKVNERTIELEQANNELKLKSEFVETIIDSSVDVIAVFDKDLKYVVLNQYGREIYSLGENSVIGKSITEVFPKIKTSVMYTNLLKAFDGEVIHDPYYKSWLSNCVLENFYIPLKDKNQKVYNVLVIGHDITKITEANDKLRVVNEELEKSNHDLEQFAFVASHDLQEPLRKIQTYASLLEKNADNGGLTDKYLSKVISSAARMSDLIKAVLSYSRISDGKMNFEPVDLNEVIENIKTDYELTIGETNARITAVKLPVIMGNPLQLNQLFLNLISNSIKFCSNQPEINISCRVISKPADTDEDFNAKSEWVEISFQDNGIGFDQQYAEKIFTVFQRLHTQKEYKGTGIGLAICRKIIDNHKGYISVQSTVGKGTTFKIQLPLESKLARGEWLVENE